MTTSLFYEYICFLGLFRYRIWIEEDGAHAIVGAPAPLGNFSQIINSERPGAVHVRLSRKDYEKEAITGGFFNGRLK